MKSRPYYTRPKILGLIALVTVISALIPFLGNVPTASAADCSWWNASWTRRRKITFDNSDQAQNLVNFPALMIFTSSNINYGQTQGEGQDLRFIDDDCTTLLDYEIEDWNESGSSYVWVSVTQIDASSDTDFVWVYYGNSGAAAGQDKEATWNSSYESVWHLHDDFLVSTDGNHDGTNNGSSDTTGVVADGQSFDGSNDYINTNYSSNYGSGVNFTFEGWFNVTTSISGSDDILGIEDRGGGDNSEIRMAVRESGDGSNPVSQVDIYIRPNSGVLYGDFTATTPASNQWHHLAIVRDGSTGRTYMDGTQLNSESGISTVALGFPVTLLIGAQWESDVGGGSTRNELEGKIDEVRTSTTNHSAQWIAATYKTIKDNANFTDYGTEQLPPSHADVYYSVGSSTDNLKVGGSLTVSISSGTATFSEAQANNIGVGDVITYNTSNKAYVSGRTSSTIYSVITATGGTPGNVTNATVNSITRTFNTLGAAVTQSDDAGYLGTSDLTSGGGLYALLAGL